MCTACLSGTLTLQLQSIGSSQHDVCGAMHLAVVNQRLKQARLAYAAAGEQLGADTMQQRSTAARQHLNCAWWRAAAIPQHRHTGAQERAYAYPCIHQPAPVPCFCPCIADAKFQHTGLERTAALEGDVQWLQQQYNLAPPEIKADGPGMQYAEHLRQLAANDPQYFICHYYNFYFAHTAGGRMIGSKVRHTRRAHALLLLLRRHNSRTALQHLQQLWELGAHAAVAAPAAAQAGGLGFMLVP